MAWRIQLSESNIKRLEILSGRPSLLAVWTRSNQIVFLDLQTGIQKSEQTVTPPEEAYQSNGVWKSFMDSLKAPNGVFPPQVRLKNGASIYFSSNGTLRLYNSGGKNLYFYDNDQENILDPINASGNSTAENGNNPPVSAAMDRAMGLIVTLDRDAQLSIYNKQVYVGKFPSTLKINDEFKPILLVTKGSSKIIATDGHYIVSFDSEGKLRSRVELHYTIGAINCSSDGRRLVIGDQDANVIRIHSGTDLRPTHQRFAVDLMAEAKKIQLLTTPEVTRAALGPLAINSKGVLAFAIAGTLCVTNLARMKSVPRPSIAKTD